MKKTVTYWCLRCGTPTDVEITHWSDDHQPRRDVCCAYCCVQPRSQRASMAKQDAIKSLEGQAKRLLETVRYIKDDVRPPWLEKCFGRPAIGADKWPNEYVDRFHVDGGFRPTPKKTPMVAEKETP